MANYKPDNKTVWTAGQIRNRHIQLEKSFDFKEINIFTEKQFIPKEAVEKCLNEMIAEEFDWYHRYGKTNLPSQTEACRSGERKGEGRMKKEIRFKKVVESRSTWFYSQITIFAFSSLGIVFSLLNFEVIYFFITIAVFSLITSICIYSEDKPIINVYWVEK